MLSTFSNISLLLSLLAISSLTNAKTIIGILDSGIDYKHSKLEDFIFNNPKENLNSRDDDRNGYIDDIRGWNFIKESPEIFDYSLYGTFSKEVYRYYELRAKKTLGTSTPEEEAWLKKMLKDEEFKEERSRFRSYIHGSHIAGIALHANSYSSQINLEVLPIGYLGKAEKGLAKEPEFKPLSNGSINQRLAYLEGFLISKYKKWQLKKLKTAIDYAADFSNVVNGSFGKSYKGSKKYVTELYKKQFPRLKESSLKKNPHKERIENLSLNFLKVLIDGTENIAKSYPKMMFVFSAGNSKQDVDQFLHYPSNARADNILAVGASKDFLHRASFSNFGATTVDLMAPGVAIKSTIPEDRFLRSNGTSQASPFIANIIAIAFEVSKKLNLKITPKGLKKILLSTVDKKTSLKGKSVSEGIVNPKRFFYALEGLIKYSMDYSIKRSLSNIQDQEPDHIDMESDKTLQNFSEALPLPSDF